ncbi:hypothetical protein CIB93_06335 [Streptomyces sp. WZ.A104]|uniref:hypothetical protein n=1 Tax=Streptomyces sp. WZ.A104 TaxID=2023771 RepID=UPI000BBCABA1|nr:hypothetical protein [Streptomyces sp. WZ.A104]PCG86834.1 hypothetical protein CIB93_06335 [Streptomyces sp. WZ.A104]
MPVSATTTTKPREAVQRLLAGQPLRTDGALTKENLAREAGGSHTTVHRAGDVLAEWDVKAPRQALRTPTEVQRDETIDDLRKKLREEKQQVTELTGKLDSLASVTANLCHKNQTPRRKPGKNQRLTALPDVD